MDNYFRQLDIEHEVTHTGIARGHARVQAAFDQHRAVDTPAGQMLFRKSFEQLLPEMEKLVTTKTRGRKAKYLAMLRRLPADILTAITLRVVINKCALTEPATLQDCMRDIGQAIETEVLIDRLTDAAPWYTKKLKDQIQDEHVTSTHHIMRKFRTEAKDLDLDIDYWTSEERQNCGKLCLEAAYELGLFQWGRLPSSKGHAYYVIEPTPVMAEYLEKTLINSPVAIQYPPMIVKPRDWIDFRHGGYLSDEMNVHAPMMTLRRMPKEIRTWIVQRLATPEASEVRAAMNKAQAVPYRVNKRVMEIAQKAIANPAGILGLPKHGEAARPEWPFPENWTTDDATLEELEIFKAWKADKKLWFQTERERKGKKLGLVQKLQEVVKYSDQPEIYFPTFLDWRGRMYFRSNLNPQSHDLVKGCLEYAHGKRIGKEGLFWLKVDVANCCGYDKHDPVIKAKWTEDNWDMIKAYLMNPLEVDPPEKDTAFTLLSAGFDLDAALSLPNPEDYVSHHIVAMDATCSGLQHYSAMFRDEVGAKFTNLIDSDGDQKQDIYAEVKNKALGMVNTYEVDPFVRKYWRDHEVTRKMAKRPVMTYVYSATMQSCMEYVAADMQEAGYERYPEYSYIKLSIPVAKSLRQGVELTVPKASEGMKYLQKLVRQCDTPLKWVNPVGVPVANFTEKYQESFMNIMSMGVSRVWIRRKKEGYDQRSACSGISPNFVHSLDSAHLCKTINAFSSNVTPVRAAFDRYVTPIHDSFGTHPSDVGELHKVLREEFHKMYQEDVLGLLLKLNEFREEPVRPTNGALNLDEVLGSRFMFC